MSVLHNRVSNLELKQKLYEETFPRTTISFYQYFNIQDPQVFRDEMYRAFNAMKVFGRIYIATEGINAQISVPTHNLEVFRNFLYSFKPLKGLRLNIAVNDDGKSFWVLRIKVREKIVADGISDPNFSMENKGKYVNAQEMNNLLESEDTIVIDMRNHYEYEVGHFEKAIEIPSDTFREQLPMAADMMKDNKDKNIIMYCTGGIRCEKSTAYLKEQGFDEVYHLKGGILKYLETVPPEQTLWEGECFVFDERVTVNLQLEKGQYDQCNACRLPITEADKASPHYEQGVSCPHCFDKVSDAQKARFIEREKQMALAKQRGEAHIGTDAAKSLIAKREAKQKRLLAKQQQMQQQQ